MDSFQISFDESLRAQPVPVPAGQNLSECLDIENSPLLFGCRTGICGTCMIEVQAVLRGTLAPPSEEEQDLLSIVAPGNPRARLACQIKLSADIQVKPISDHL